MKPQFLRFKLLYLMLFLAYQLKGQELPISTIVYVADSLFKEKKIDLRVMRQTKVNNLDFLTLSGDDRGGEKFFCYFDSTSRLMVIQERTSSRKPWYHYELSYWNGYIFISLGLIVKRGKTMRVEEIPGTLILDIARKQILYFKTGPYGRICTLLDASLRPTITIEYDERVYGFRRFRHLEVSTEISFLPATTEIYLNQSFSISDFLSTIPTASVVSEKKIVTKISKYSFIETLNCIDQYAVAPKRSLVQE